MSCTYREHLTSTPKVHLPIFMFLITEVLICKRNVSSLGSVCIKRLLFKQMKYSALGYGKHKIMLTIVIIIMNFVGLGNNAWKPIQGTDIHKNLKKCQTDGADVNADGKGRV